MTERNWNDLVTFAPEVFGTYKEILAQLEWKDLVTFTDGLDGTYQEVLDRINK